MLVQARADMCRSEICKLKRKNEKKNDLSRISEYCNDWHVRYWRLACLSLTLNGHSGWGTELVQQSPPRRHCRMEFRPEVWHVSSFSDGRFGAESQDEFVGFGFDDLLGDVEVRQRWDATKQRDVILSQLEHSAVLNAPRQQNVAHQRPRLNGHFLLVILSIQWTKSVLGTFL